MALLCGCARTAPVRDLRASDLDPSQGIVIFGIAIANNEVNQFGYSPGVYGEWVAYDPQSGQRSGKIEADVDTGTGPFMASEIRKGATAYRFYKLPPGNYALGWLRHKERGQDMMTNYLLMYGKLTTYYQGVSPGVYTEGGQMLSNDARVEPITPRFNVGANEIVYIGDLVVDVGHTGRIEWTVRVDEPAARNYAAAAGAAERLTVRPMTRANGTPIGAADSVAAPVKH